MKKPIQLLVWLSLASGLLLLTACSDKSKSGPTDTHLKGRIAIVADETLKPLVAAQVASYEARYPQTKFDVAYLPEREAFQRFLNDSDSVRVIIAARPLKEGEARRFDARKWRPKSFELAKDAVALIAHPSNPDTALTIDQLRGILSGKITEWAQLGRPGRKGKIIPVFDSGNSSTLRFLADSLMQGDTLALSKFYAAGTNEAVIDYVAINENALGFIGYNWLSNAKDPSVIDRSEEIRLVQLPSTQNPKKMIKLERAPNFFLRENLYPLTRELVVLSRELHQGLGTGFVNYILGPEGQRLVLMAGLYPVKPVSRQVELVPVPAVD